MRTRTGTSLGADQAGFTIVELMTVVMIIAALVSIAIPGFAEATKLARARACEANRTVTEQADHTYYMQNQSWAAGIDALVGTHLTSRPECPSGGVYLWLDTPTPQRPARTLGCSVHYAPTEPPTQLGYDFNEISTNMMSLLTSYFSANGKWPRSFSPYNFTDIGLAAGDWAKPVDHIYYSPIGNRMAIRPEDGYQFTVKDTKGKTMTMDYGDKWSLVYSALDGKWYYKSVTPGQEIDVSTLVVAPKK